MRQIRIALWVVVAIALVGLAILMTRAPADRSTISERIGAATFGGPFTLTGADGQPFSSSKLAGKPHAVFFGFTHCPDVCPTTLARLVRLREQLGEDEQPFEILFISVDPERDGPAEVRKYSELFDSPVIGLTGSPAQIDQVKRQFGIYSQKVPDGSGGYSVDHTASVLLFDGQGDFVATLSPEEQDRVALDKLRRITA
jgi:protein SCO1/2